jgi:hypothetical protein
MRKIGLVLILAGLAPAPAAADIKDVARDYFAAHQQTWSSNPVLLAAVRSQNGANSGLGQAQILALDSQWRQEVGMAAQPTISPVLNAPASEILREYVAASDGLISEFYMMDKLGMNVAVASVSTDYWQGDEEKFTASYLLGNGAVHVSDVDFDESSQTFSVQVSFTLTDPFDGTPIGAMTVGLNAEALD